MVNLAKGVASGGVTGALTLCFVYSLDFARTRLANDVISINNGASGRKYDGFVDVYRKTLATDGIAGLYRGFIMSCVQIVVYRACYFGLYDTLRAILIGPDGKHLVLLGYGVTIISGFLSYPFDTVARRMMMTSGEAVQYKGVLDCMVQIVRNEGVRALYKGVDLIIIKSIAGAILLAGFDKLVQRYVAYKNNTNTRD
jgi:solute carrier family 25 (adenine nucleotide translocator) protein 4/5/6/31